YIAGFVTAEGLFSAVLSRRTKNKQHYHRLDLKFILQLNQKYKNLILEIQNQLGNKGNFIYYDKDKTIKYQICNQSDLLNVVIPFFMKYPLRGEKLLSFLHFKYILSVMSTKSHLKNKNIFLSLIVIAGQINPTDKLGNKIRYLKPEEQHYVINNIQPEGIDISKLKESIVNFKPNPLTLYFVHGLLESDSSHFKLLSLEDQNYIRNYFLPEGIEL
ncbi:homing endonuclease, partial [Tuber indicum]